MLRAVMPTRCASSAIVMGHSTSDDALTLAPPRRNSAHDIRAALRGRAFKAGCAATGVTAHPVLITLADADTKSCKGPGTSSVVSWQLVPNGHELGHREVATQPVAAVDHENVPGDE